MPINCRATVHTCKHIGLRPLVLCHDLGDSNIRHGVIYIDRNATDFSMWITDVVDILASDIEVMADVRS